MLVGGYYLLRPKVENEPMPTMAEIKRMILLTMNDHYLTQLTQLDSLFLTLNSFDSQL